MRHLYGKDISMHYILSLQQSDYKVINKDQWCNVLEFCRTVKSDLSNYDVDGACKLIYCIVFALVP